nr:PREDICTED: cathepsin L 2-like [Bemisia tabaci]
MVEYAKSYTSFAEKMMRFSVFKENLRIIADLMAGQTGTKFGIGPYTDMTAAEFARVYMNSPGERPLQRQRRTPTVTTPFRNFTRMRDSYNLDSLGPSRKRPASFPPAGNESSEKKTKISTAEANPVSDDESTSEFRYFDGPKLDPKPSDNMYWVNSKYYPDPQDQFEPQWCGSCWAFTTAGTLEIVLSREKKAIVRFSKQQLVDCVKRAHGCNGADVIFPLTYLKVKGIAKEEDYPYTAKNGTCNEKAVRSAVKVKMFHTKHSEEEIMEALKYSPVIVNMHVPAEFQHYRGGLFDSKYCKSNSTTRYHSMILVGIENEQWVLRDSSGLNWGEKGHVFIKIGECDIGRDSYAITEWKDMSADSGLAGSLH